MKVSHLRRDHFFVRPAASRLFLHGGLIVVAILLVGPSAVAVPIFNSSAGPDGVLGTGGGGISFGVAPWLPIFPGAPTYLANNFNGRTDILTNPGVGQTADPVIANNTSSVVVGPWLPGGGVFNVQIGGGNVWGPFGAGAAAVNGPNFGFDLSDGGIPGGVSTSYQIMSWDANFTDAAGSGVGTLGTFIGMVGTLPLVQDLAILALRTELSGPNIGVVEVPGLILAVERTGALTYAALALQDGLAGAATAMPGGFAIAIDAPTGAFAAVAFNVFPDLGAIDGLAIPAGENFTARATATVYADPADVNGFPAQSFFDVFTELDITPFPNSPPVTLPNQILIGSDVPEPATIVLVAIGAIGVALCARRKRRRP
jgi:hypothetical protein